MKSAGLSSTYRTMLKKATKINTLAHQHNHYLAGKEKQKLLRQQAAKAQFERQQREKALQPEAGVLCNNLEEIS